MSAGTPSLGGGAAPGVANRVIAALIRLGVGGFFVYASVNKIVDSPEVFSKAIRTYQMLDPRWTNVPGIILPWLELFCGVLLILGVWLREVRALILAMLAVFIVATAAALARGLEIDCGCTGKSGSSNGWTVITRNSVFILLLAFDVWLLRRVAPPPAVSEPLEPPSYS